MTEINILPWLSRGALEYICQAAVGHSFDALNVDKENEYLEAIRKLALERLFIAVTTADPLLLHSPSSLRLIMIRPLIPFIVRNFSLYWRNKIMDWVPLEALRDLRGVVQVMDTTSKKIFAEKKAIMEGRTEPDGAESLRSRVKGKDIMSIMCKSYKHIPVPPR